MAKKNEGKATKSTKSKKKIVRTGIAKSIIVFSSEPELGVGDTAPLTLISNFIFGSGARPTVDSVSPPGFTVDITIDSQVFNLMTLRLTLTGTPFIGDATETEITVSISIVDGGRPVPVPPFPVMVLD